MLLEGVTPQKIQALDSGFSGDENLKMLRSKNYAYIAIGKRPTRVAYDDEFNTLTFRKIEGREGKEPVSIAFIDEENERVVLCHSEARGEKEKAILSNAEKKFLDSLQKLSKRLNKKEGRGCLKTESSANQALGKIKGRHSRIARYYSLSIEVVSLEKKNEIAPLDPSIVLIGEVEAGKESERTPEYLPSKEQEPSLKTSKKKKDSISLASSPGLNQEQKEIVKKRGRKPKTTSPIDEKEVSLRLIYERIDEAYLKAEGLCGSYYMQCSRKDLDDETIWKLYMTLTRVETGFRTLKSDLGLRPIFHHREDRCDSHIFITVLAYRILHWIEYSLRQKNDRRSWATVRRVLQTHCYTTVTCPSEDGAFHHIRVAGMPERAHMEIYESLEVCWKNLPRNHICKKTINRIPL